MTIMNNSFCQSGLNCLIQFEVDGNQKCIHGNFDLLMKEGDHSFHPLLFTNGFIVPDFLKAENIDLTFKYEKKELVFKNVPTKFFNTKLLIIGEDTKVKKSKYLPKDVDAYKIKAIRYLRFDDSIVIFSTYELKKRYRTK